MASSNTADPKKHVVKSVEGKPLDGKFVVSSLINGNDMTMLEVHLEPGDRTPLHKHGHESLIYVVEGKLKTNVGQETHILGRGDAGLHPRNVEHCVEAIERTTVIEIKSCRWEEAQAIWSASPPSCLSSA